MQQVKRRKIFRKKNWNREVVAEQMLECGVGVVYSITFIVVLAQSTTISPTQFHHIIDILELIVNRVKVYCI